MAAWCEEADILKQLPDLATYTSGAAAGYVADKIAEATGSVRSYLSRYRDLFETWTVPEEVRQAVVVFAIHAITLRRARLMEDPDATPFERDYKDKVAWLKDVSRGVCELEVDWPNRREQGGHTAVIAGAHRKASL